VTSNIPSKHTASSTSSPSSSSSPLKKSALKKDDELIDTFAQMMDDFFFHDITNVLAEIFGTSLDYDDVVVVDDSPSHVDEVDGEQVNADHDPSQPHQRQQQQAQDEEPYIPCEFCNDSIRASLFEAHTFACRSGRLPAFDDTIQAITSSSSSSEVSENTVLITPPIEKKKARRPDIRSPQGISLIQSLLDSITTICSAYNDDDDDSSAMTPYHTISFSSLLDSTFDLLDRDHEGFISATDR